MSSKAVGAKVMLWFCGLLFWAIWFWEGRGGVAFLQVGGQRKKGGALPLSPPLSLTEPSKASVLYPVSHAV